MDTIKRISSQSSRWALGALVCCVLQVATSRLLADTAPTSIAGTTIYGSITGGNGYLASYGSFYLITSATGDAYQMQPVSGPGTSDAGSYAYAKSTMNGDEGSLVLYPSLGGPARDSLLTFTSATGGSYYASIESGIYGWQTGTFEQVSPGVVTLTEPPDGSSPPARQPQFSWSQSNPAATWFYLWINRNGSAYIQQWMQATNWTPTNDLPGGDYTWAVQTWSTWYGPWSAVSSFSIAGAAPGTVTLTAPENGAMLADGTHSTFSWTGSTPAATWYYLWINRNGSPYVQEWMQSTNWTPSSGLPAGNYSWAVRTWNVDGYGPWSSVAAFTVGNAPGAATLRAPGNAATLADSAQPTFSWSGSTPAATWYYLWINHNGSAYTQKWTQSTSWTPSSSLPAGSYTWAVQTWNSDGYGPWSSAASFTVGIPGSVTLYGPSGTPGSSQPSFSWSGSSPAATWYYLWINHNGSAYIQKWTQSTSWTPSSSLPAGSYTWAVQTWNPDGYGPWSSVMSFSL